MSMTDMRAPAGLFLILYQFDGLRYYVNFRYILDSSASMRNILQTSVWT